MLGALLLMLPALLNGFPFVFPDSGDYLTLAPKMQRAPFYGLFITFFHLNQFIWMPIIMQSVVVSHLLWLLWRVSQPHVSSARFLAAMAVLTLLSSLPYFTGFIMADIFTPILFLVMYLLSFHLGQLSRPMVGYLFLLGCVACTTHSSNLGLGIGLWCVCFTLQAWRRSNFPKRRASRLLTAAILVLTVIATLLYQGIIFKRWALTPAASSFFMANLIEGGPARHYLKEACPEANYALCAHVDHLPATAEDLLWFTDLYAQLGGFEGMREESATIVHETLTTRPWEVAEMVVTNVVRGATTYAPAAEFKRRYQVPAFLELLENKFGTHAVQNYLTSAEMRDALPYDTLRHISFIVVPVSFVMLIGLAIRHRRTAQHPSFLLPVTVVCYVLGNLLLCTALSGVHHRYQARVTWLMPMCALLCISAYRRKSHLDSPTTPAAPEAWEEFLEEEGDCCGGCHHKPR